MIYCKMIIGYTVGVFDQLHYGHKNLLLESQKLCDKLIIGVHTDKFTESYKRLPLENENIRKQNIIKFLNINSNQVVIIDDNHIDIIKKNNVNVIFHGSDWELESYKKQIRYNEGINELNVSIQLINYSKGISTTNIINNNVISLKSKKCFLFDLDNTLVLNKKLMKFSKDIIDKLKILNKDIYVISNNNRYNIRQISEILKDLEIDESNIVTTLKIIVNFLKQNEYKKIYVWGTQNAKDFLIENNFELIDEDPDIIVVLYNNKFDYNDICKLCSLVLKIPYIIGNIDAIYPEETLRPDTGCLWKYIEYCCNKIPLQIFGKPYKIIDHILKKYEKKDIILIGDSEKTDKQLAINNNIDFIRVHPEGDISHLGILCDYL